MLLNENDKEKINKIIKDIIQEIKGRFPEEDKDLEITFKEVEKRTVDIVKNRVNNLFVDLELCLQKSALKREVFSSPQNQVLFYRKNLFKKVKEENKFDMTQKIEYKKVEELEKKIKELGIIFTASGAISIIISSIIPVSIGIIIVGVLYCTAKKNPEFRKKKFNEKIKIYLKNLETSLQKWVESVDIYYEKEVNKLEDEIENSKKELKDGKE